MKSNQSILSNPNLQLVLFDGECNLCNRWVLFTLTRDKYTVFTFCSLQSNLGKQIQSKFTSDRMKVDSVIYIKGDKVYIQSSAALRIFRDLGFPYSLLYIFISIPAFLRNIVYNWIARKRYDYFGKSEKCMIPTEETKDRFVF